MGSQADQTVEIYVGGEPASPANPVPTAPAPGSGATTVDQGGAGTDPWKVDDDASQTALAAILAAIHDGTLRGTVTITDGSGPVTIDGTVTITDGSGPVTIDGTAATTVADGADVALGTTTDAAVVTDANGSALGKLRGLVKILADVWDSTNHFLKVALQPTTAGGLSVYETIDQQNGGNAVKGAAGQLYGYFIANRSSAERFVKLYNKATAPSSADTPFLVFAMPAFSAANVAHPNGVAFDTGIGIRACTGIANNDNTAPTANDVVVNLLYK